MVFSGFKAASVPCSVGGSETGENVTCVVRVLSLKKCWGGAHCAPGPALGAKDVEASKTQRSPPSQTSIRLWIKNECRNKERQGGQGKPY